MGLVLLVMGIKFLCLRNHPRIQRMCLAPDHLDHDGLVHAVRDHVPDQFFAPSRRLCVPHYFFSPAIARSRTMVLTRAMSLRKPRIFFKLSVWPMFNWNFSLKSWSFISRSWCRNSSSVRFLIFSASINSYLAVGPERAAASSCFSVRCLALHQRRPQRQFVRRQAHRFARVLVRHAFHLKQNLSRLHHRDPVVGRPLTLAHTGLGRFLGHRLVGKNADPDLAAALDEPGHGHAAGFDLPVS